MLVNAVATGPVETPLINGERSKLSAAERPQRLASLAAMTPMGLATLEQVVNALLFLVSDEASFITGQVPVVDGGQGSRVGRSALAPEADPRVRHLTIRHLVTMRSGFQWDEQSYESATERADRDLVNFTVRRPLVHVPGTRFSYDSYGSHLLSIVLARAAGLPTAVFAEENLFRRLGIRRFQWDADRDGHHWGGKGLYLRSRDLAKIGQLYLNKGAWREAQLISPEFVETATRQHAEGGWPAQVGYGYHWWVPTAPPSRRVFFALGYGGQSMLVAPALGIVLVITSDQRVPGDTQWIMREFVLRSVVG